MCCFFCFQACSYFEYEVKNAALPESGCAFAEIVLLSDKQTLEIIRPGLDSAIGIEQAGLYPPERIFKKRVANDSYFKGFFQKHCQVIILLHQENWHRFKNLFGKQSSETIEKKLADTSIWYFTTNDVWSKPQTVHFVIAKNATKLNRILLDKASNLRDKAFQTEITIGKDKMFRGIAHKDTFYKKMLSGRGFAIHKAPSYRIAAEKEDFIWLRKSTQKCNYELVITEEPFSNDNQFKSDYIINRRNQIGKKYIHGEDSSYMGTDFHVKPVSAVNEFNGMYCIETRGWWKLMNDWMGGPFVVYTIFDGKHNRVITLEGNVYAPHEEKVERLRELEVILHSLVVK